MEDGEVLELSSLPKMHPCGSGLLDRFGTPTICRLSVDPSQLPSGTMDREVDINWIKRSSPGTECQAKRRIGWRGIPNAEQVAAQLPWTVNNGHLTEYAACGIMALLIHALEGEKIQTVLQIGEGPDFLVCRGPAHANASVEVSGIRQVETPGQSQYRVAEKRIQLLKSNEQGYVSVTSFSHPPGAIVHSYLHFVARHGRQKPLRQR
jgi:hypothetical protein